MLRHLNLDLFRCRRFGLWDAIIAEPLPDNPEMYPTGTTTAHYARGIAFASQGLVGQAEQEQVGEAAFLVERSYAACIGVVGIGFRCSKAS